VIVRPISIRWISDVPSKIVKILADMGRVIGVPCNYADLRKHRHAGLPITPARGGTAALSRATHGFPAAKAAARYA
jgi:hypothetical protein